MGHRQLLQIPDGVPLALLKTASRPRAGRTPRKRTSKHEASLLRGSWGLLPTLALSSEDEWRSRVCEWRPNAPLEPGRVRGTSAPGPTSPTAFRLWPRRRELEPPPAETAPESAAHRREEHSVPPPAHAGRFEIRRGTTTGRRADGPAATASEPGLRRRPSAPHTPTTPGWGPLRALVRAQTEALDRQLREPARLVQVEARAHRLGGVV